MKNVVQTAKHPCAIYGYGAIADGSVPMWFAWFRVVNFDLEEQKC